MTLIADTFSLFQLRTLFWSLSWYYQAINIDFLMCLQNLGQFFFYMVWICIYGNTGRTEPCKSERKGFLVP